MNLRQLVMRFCPRKMKLPLRRFYSGRKMTTSQVGQDFWVFGEVFDERHGGYFLDIGAADGIYLSNTFLLEKRYHWRGICIEASPTVFPTLKQARTSTCLNVCVDSREREIDFVLVGLYGGIVDEDTDYKREQVAALQAEVLKLKTKQLADILKAESAPRIIDYCSIDVEGAEERILGNFPFNEYRFNCMTIERPAERLRDLLKYNGYVLVKDLPRMDAFYVHESWLEDYRQNMFRFWQRKSH